MKYKKEIDTKIGNICIIEEENQIIEIKINEKIEEQIIQKETKLLKETEKQLKEYLEGVRKKFTVPLNPKGTNL